MLAAVNPTDGVGGSFILNLKGKGMLAAVNPTDGVGGSFIFNLQGDGNR
jgi:hypothetical protein